MISEKRRRLVEAARAIVGRKYAFQGRNEFGVDCAGTMTLPAIAAGLAKVPDSFGYAPTSSGSLIPKMLDPITRVIPLEEALPGDVLTFRRGRVAREEHFAWLSFRNKIIHAWDEDKGVVEVEFDKRWRNRLVKVRRLLELD